MQLGIKSSGAKCALLLFRRALRRTMLRKVRHGAKHAGRERFKFQLHIKAHFVEGMPLELWGEDVSLQWSRGSKMVMTQPVETGSDIVQFGGEDLSAVVTLYQSKAGKKFSDKHCYLKVVRRPKGKKTVKEVCAADFNLSDYASYEEAVSQLNLSMKWVDPAHKHWTTPALESDADMAAFRLLSPEEKKLFTQNNRELGIPRKPTVSVSISTTWLKDYEGGDSDDTMSVGSMDSISSLGMDSTRDDSTRDTPAARPSMDDEQDLSGFPEPAGGKVEPPTPVSSLAESAPPAVVHQAHYIKELHEVKQGLEQELAARRTAVGSSAPPPVEDIQGEERLVTVHRVDGKLGVFLAEDGRGLHAVVGLAEDSDAARNKLLQVGDVITLVDGLPVMGKLAEELPATKQAFEFTVVKTEGGTKAEVGPGSRSSLLSSRSSRASFFKNTAAPSPPSDSAEDSSGHPPHAAHFS